MSDSWTRVSKNNPCPICEKKDWCMFSPDGAVVVCMRMENNHPAKGGFDGGHYFRIGEPSSYEKKTERDEPLLSFTVGPALGPRGLRDRDGIYRAFARVLGLADHHTQHLETVRGLPYSALDGFASLSSARKEKAIGAALLAAKGSLDGVPGFARKPDGGPYLVAPATGLLIPIPDENGRIQAYQIRSDLSKKELDDRGYPRYSWLSSSDRPGGIGSGSPVAVYNWKKIDGGELWLTEGPLKGLISSLYLDKPFLSIQGVSNWKLFLPRIPPNISKIVLAFDADSEMNPFVRRAEEALANELYSWGYAPLKATWLGKSEVYTEDSGIPKGIDDALLRGIRPEVQPFS